MKVVHVPWTFYPDDVGGTEIYVESLVRELQARGVTNTIAAPGPTDRTYAHNGVAVRRFAGSSRLDLRDQYGSGDPRAASTFARILDEERPDIVHLHAYSSAVSLALLRQAHARRLPTLFTYHTPAVSCLRGDLVRRGEEVCTGELNVSMCTMCSLHARGLPLVIGRMVAMMPVQLGRGTTRMGLGGPVVTALRMPELVEAHHRALTDLLCEADHIVVLCKWARELLLLNGITADRITLCRHGIDQGHLSGRATPSQSPSGPLRLVYFGRLDPIKGLDVVIRALRLDMDLPVHLDIHGVVQGTSGTRHLAHLRQLADDDRRITFLPPVPSHQVLHLLRGYDAVVVPSQCLETGPLVVLEAFAAGVPVLGSDLGGISELVSHERDGLLIDPAYGPMGWQEAIRGLVDGRDMLARLKRGVRPPRTMTQVAADMTKLYADLTRRFLPVETRADG